jgi:hypothetical protein
MPRIEERDARLADNEKRLHELLVQALDGDTAAYHAFLKALSTHCTCGLISESGFFNAQMT